MTGGGVRHALDVAVDRAVTGPHGELAYVVSLLCTTVGACVLLALARKLKVVIP